MSRRAIQSTYYTSPTFRPQPTGIVVRSNLTPPNPALHRLINHNQPRPLLLADPALLARRAAGAPGLISAVPATQLLDQSHWYMLAPVAGEAAIMC